MKWLLISLLNSKCKEKNSGLGEKMKPESGAYG